MLALGNIGNGPLYSTHKHIYAHTHTRYTHIHTYIHPHPTHTHTHTYIHMHARTTHKHTVHTHTLIRHTNTYTYIHMHARYTNIHTHPHPTCTHIHTYIRTHSRTAIHLQHLYESTVCSAAEGRGGQDHQAPKHVGGQATQTALGLRAIG